MVKLLANFSLFGRDEQRMTSGTSNEDMSFAAYKLRRVREAMSDQIVVIFRLKSFGLDATLAERDLDKINAEFRKWKEYETLLLIRKAMIEQVNENT